MKFRNKIKERMETKLLYTVFGKMYSHDIFIAVKSSKIIKSKNKKSLLKMFERIGDCL
jgi:hypothetical protein